jgi:hypothetical protein
MSGPDAYVMLLSSLPHHGALTRTKQTPLSRLRLNARLKVLAPEDAEALQLVEDLLSWELVQKLGSDAEVVRRAKQTMASLDSPFLKAVLRQRLELRTVIAALRRRRRGLPAPRTGEVWGFGRWTDHIARNWGDPAFGLARVFPWVREADRLIKEDDAYGFERLVLEEVWRDLGRAGEGHTFDFEAVVVYVLRWNVVERWTAYNEATAKECFVGLVEAGMSQAGDLFGEAANG